MKNFPSAQAAMTGLKEIEYRPVPESEAVYGEMYPLYKDLHDALGTREHSGDLAHVMKRLIEIRERAKA